MTVMPDCNINDKITAVVRMILLMVTRRRWRKRMSWSSERRKGEGSSSNLYTHYRYHFLIRHRSLLIALCLGIQLTFPRPWISKEMSQSSFLFLSPRHPSPLQQPASPSLPRPFADAALAISKRSDSRVTAATSPKTKTFARYIKARELCSSMTFGFIFRLTVV